MFLLGITNKSFRAFNSFVVWWWIFTRKYHVMKKFKMCLSCLMIFLSVFRDEMEIGLLILYNKGVDNKYCPALFLQVSLPV